ncbi:hypothetical protein KPH14_005529 [Odynerus spinipes]|uniref:Uncharacterized protein n=1 Tax=Odynerus spinipes TaxID=1348599 RepID=A0AAD9RBY6_9HYME|nr:hypothetical protein KPH14_005529 [Odynerus spinipes]
MLRALIIAVLIGSGLAGSIVKRSDNGQQSQPQQQSQQSTSTQNQISNQLQTYPSSQGNQLPSMQYQYPSYPEYSDSGYGLRSGLEGYLVPITTSSHDKHEWSSGLVTSLIPFASNVMTYGAQVGTYLLHFLLALVVGGVVTTLVCTFTPVCSISFLGLSLSKYGVKEQVADLARTYITPESVNAATVLVTKAIDKYNAMQRERREKPKQE